ncbi:MAG: hypothetical protein Q4D58_01635 [Synergistaceae bacterium]|nr:hypothetical protein [Synergistaceae bacterium]
MFIKASLQISFSMNIFMAPYDFKFGRPHGAAQRKKPPAPRIKSSTKVQYNFLELLSSGGFYFFFRAGGKGKVKGKIKVKDKVKSKTPPVGSADSPDGETSRVAQIRKALIWLPGRLCEGAGD